MESGEAGARRGCLHNRCLAAMYRLVATAHREPSFPNTAEYFLDLNHRTETPTTVFPWACKWALRARHNRSIPIGYVRARRRQIDCSGAEAAPRYQTGCY